MLDSAERWSSLARGRHLRLAWYLLLSLGLTLVAHYYLGLDRLHATGYAVATYVMLNVLNYRAVLSKVERPRQSSEVMGGRGKQED